MFRNRWVDFPRNYILTPAQASSAPLLSELSARFPEWSAQDIQALMEDHEDEIKVLSRYRDEADLERRIKEIAELVSVDIVNESLNEDDSMTM